MYGIVLVHHIDSFSLYRKFDVDCASTIVGWQHSLVSFGGRIVLRISPFPFTVDFAISVLKAVLTDVAQASPITANFWIVGMTFRVFEPISIFDSCYDGPAYRQPEC